MPDRVLELDPASLKALAHPVRTRILRLLEVRDRASATTLAAELGESTGTTSYHLRQLAAHGFVTDCEAADDGADGDGDSDGTAADEAARRAAGRPARWWRLAADSVHVTGFGLAADADTSAAMSLVSQAWLADRAERARNWVATALEWSAEWQAASSDADAVLTLDPAQTRALADELAAVMARYRALPPGPAARKVDVAYSVFPAEDGTRA